MTIIKKFNQKESEFFPDQQYLPEIVDPNGKLYRPEIIFAKAPTWLHDSQVFHIFWAGLILCYYSEYIGKNIDRGLDFPKGICTEYNFENAMAMLEDMECFMCTANSLEPEQYKEHSNLGSARKILNWWWKECNDDNASHLFKELKGWISVYKRRQRGKEFPAIIKSFHPLKIDKNLEKK